MTAVLRTHFTTFASLAILGHSLALNGGSAPTIGTLRCLPPAITPSSPYVLTLFITIVDPTVIPASVNLLSISANGTTTIAGQLNDSGQNGDAIAGDGVYTIQLPVTQPVAGQMQFQASAAFRGQLKRVLSAIISVPVTSDVGLPADPGTAGTLTLAGIDSDNDGVRDDIQRYIALTYPNSARTRAVLTQLATAFQGLVVNSVDTQQSITNATTLGHAFECNAAINGAAIAKVQLFALRAQMLNTIARSQAYLMADQQFTGQLYKLAPTQAAEQALCSFDPNSLSN